MVRICSNQEKSIDEFTHIICLIAFSLLLASFLGAICLHFLGNYFNMYLLLKHGCCGSPIVSSSLLRDIILNGEQNEIDWILNHDRDVRLHMFSYIDSNRQWILKAPPVNPRVYIYGYYNIDLKEGLKYVLKYDV